MKIVLFTPTPRGSNKGNRITAMRWAKILRELGHRVDVSDSSVLKPRVRYECMIALHARKANAATVNFQNKFPEAGLIVCLSGTDLHSDLQGASGAKARATAIQTLDRADKLVLLEPEGRSLLPDRFHDKSAVIFQSAEPLVNRPAPLKTVFEVSLIGHLRKEKNPFLAARASRRLSAESQIRIVHIGMALSAKMERDAKREMKTNPRYRWLGPMTHGETMRRLTRSRLMVLTSRIEGAPSAISEAIVNRVPVLATRIPATIGMMGAKHPGLFPVGDVNELARLMTKAEKNSRFLERLVNESSQLRNRFSFANERRSWKSLLASL